MIARTTTRRIAAVACLALLTGMTGAPLLFARQDAAPPKVEAEHLLTKPLAGEPAKEVDIQLYTFPPGSAVPWHIHPGAHEIEYGVEGTLMIEEEGKPPYPLKAGGSNYLAPDVVHRGWNASTTNPAKIYVVRIKPKGAPLAELVAPPPGAAEPDTPKAGAYPEP
jgi:quercetin dioxygenase-like cupin family protein